MDIYVSGDLSTFAKSLIIALLEDDHHIVTSCKAEPFLSFSEKNFVNYEMQVGDELYSEIFTSHSFDAVIHIMGQPELSGEDRLDQNKHLNSASLETSLQYAAQTGVQKFILISSLEVYGDAMDLDEDKTPEPTNAIGQILLNAENLCSLYAAQNNISASIIRIPLIYGPNEEYSIISELIFQSNKKKNVDIPFHKLSHCNFLHIEDLHSLIRSILNEEDPANFAVMNAAAEDINYFFLSQQLQIQFPKTSYHFSEESDIATGQKRTILKKAKTTYGWNPDHHLLEDIPELVASMQYHPQVVSSFFTRINLFFKRIRPFLVWVEIIVGALLMHMITIWTNTIIEFKVIDYRLLFVVLIGSIHGLLFGIIAAILAASSAIIAWNSIGLDFALLIYNVENWIPFTVYFLAGAVTGYVNDKKANDLRFEKYQTELIHEKYSFLFALYNEISTIKNHLREQLVGYRDSFGRFFRIANELNELDADNIFYKALEILEDLMKNDQIAIYSIESTGHFGRLQVSSKTITRNIPKSLRLEAFNEAIPQLKAGDVFQNKDLIPNYPAYIAPIMNADMLIGLVILWEVEFEQFSMYYFNLFKVITGLIQSSLVRAATFENAQYEKMFLKGTRIMRPDAFKQTLSIRNKMRRNKVSQFQILRILRGDEPWETLSEKISRGIRSEDTIGILEEKPDECYVILANATVENIDMIQDRMKKNGVDAEHITDMEIG